jgi:hypothetical protein
MSGKWPTARAAGRVAAVIAIATATLVTSLLVTGPFGLIIAADCLAALALIIAAVTVPRSVREPLVARPRSAWAWLRQGLPGRRAGRGPAVKPADFPAYAKISSDLSWAPVSAWHYDHGIRPLLAHLMASALADHHRIDAAADPARAAVLVGAEIWPLVDPSRPRSFDSKAPGADLRTLTRIVDRLEQL